MGEYRLNVSAISSLSNTSSLFFTVVKLGRERETKDTKGSKDY